MKETLKEILSPAEIQDFVSREFFLFLAKSPFSNSSESTKIAMNGSFVAGFNLATEHLIRKIEEILPR